MTINIVPPIPKLTNLPDATSLEGVASIEFEDGIPVFRASEMVQQQIESLLDKQKSGSLTPEEEAELDKFEEIDDYISFLNRVVRNLLHAQNQGS